MTRKWNIINNQSNTNYDAGNEIIYNTEVLNSNLCDNNDAYILVEGNITIAAFKNCTPFIKCITKIDETTIDDVEDLDIVMLMYNLLYRIILTQRLVYDFILEMKQPILMLILGIILFLSLSCIKLN